MLVCGVDHGVDPVAAAFHVLCTRLNFSRTAWKKFIIIIIKFTGHNALKNRNNFIPQLFSTFKDALFRSFLSSATDFCDL